MIGERAAWLTHLLAALGGGLLTALPVTGVAAHWINTARGAKHVTAIVHRQTVSPHHSENGKGGEEKKNGWKKKKRAR